MGKKKLARALEAISSRVAALEAKAGVVRRDSVPPAPLPSSTSSPAPPPASSSSSTVAATPTFVGFEFLGDLDKLIEGPDSTVGKYIRACADVGFPAVVQQAEFLAEVFREHRQFIALAACRPRPSDAELRTMLGNVQAAQAKTNMRPHRSEAHFNHLTAVSEALNVLSWVMIDKSPVSYMTELLPASDVYSNKVLTDFRRTADGEKHQAWVNALKAIFRDLVAYVRLHHLTGLTWNKTPGASPPARALPTGAPGAPAPPAPPPPPPPPPADLPTVAPRPAAGGMAAVFASLNAVADADKGTAATGLRHVLDSEKNKNRPPEERPPPSSVETSARRASMTMARRNVLSQPKGNPLFECQDSKKWVVEHYADNRDIVVSETQIHHGISIYDCHRCMIIIKGKVTSVKVDMCQKCVVVFDALVGPCEVANSKGITVQALEKCDQVLVDKTEGCQIHLDDKSANCQILTSMCTAVNVVVPSRDDVKELSIPEQFITTFHGGERVTTNAFVHSG